MQKGGKDMKQIAGHCMQCPDGVGQVFCLLIKTVSEQQRVKDSKSHSVIVFTLTL